MLMGEEWLLQKYGTRTAIAEALIEGKIGSHEEPFAYRLCGEPMLRAAEMRLNRKSRRGGPSDA